MKSESINLNTEYRPDTKVEKVFGSEENFREYFNDFVIHIRKISSAATPDFEILRKIYEDLFYKYFNLEPPNGDFEAFKHMGNSIQRAAEVSMPEHFVKSRVKKTLDGLKEKLDKFFNTEPEDLIYPNPGLNQSIKGSPEDQVIAEHVNKIRQLEFIKGVRSLEMNDRTIIVSALWDYISILKIASAGRKVDTSSIVHQYPDRLNQVVKSLY